MDFPTFCPPRKPSFSSARPSDRVNLPSASIAKKITGALATILRRCCSASLKMGAGLGWTLRTFLAVGWSDEGFSRLGWVSLAQFTSYQGVTLVTRAHLVNGDGNCALAHAAIGFG